MLALASFRAPAVSAGEIGPTEPLVSESSPRFGADVNAYLTPTGTALGFDFETPLAELSFIQVPAGYGAAVRVTVVFRGNGREQAGGDVWENRVVVATFPETREAGRRLRFHRDFRLAPGDYRVDVTLEDLSGGRKSRAQGRVRVPEFGPGALGLGDLQFGFCGPDSSFTLAPSRKFEASLDAMCVRGSIYDRRGDDSLRNYAVRSKVISETGEELVRADTVLSLGPGGEFVLRPDVRDLFLGTYTFEVEVKDGDRKWRTARTFEIETLNLPHGQNYLTVVEILSNVATREEYEVLRRADSDSARARAWDNFWARRDPTPDSPRNEAMLDFFRRVRYANSHFSGQTGAGWRTDQGRVYIRYGAPDQIEDRAATFYDPALQIWHYFGLNQRFVFADREGFGRYELISPGFDR
ncbi:MAG: GWxTD domain-containing protein [Candidatus Eisenbacteria bacterium]